MSRLWQNLWVRLAVALAFADASIVVLALPQIVDRLHSSISHLIWVIVAYNLALIAGSRLDPRRRRPARLDPGLVAGWCCSGWRRSGAARLRSLTALIPLRCLQGVGGALILCASLPLFAGAARQGDSPLYGWSAAAAIGAAVGPAAGGVLTQIFDWRSIFLAQAPFAVVRRDRRGGACVHARAAEEPAGEPEALQLPSAALAATGERSADGALRRADRGSVPGRDRVDQRLAPNADRRRRGGVDDPPGHGHC